MTFINPASVGSQVVSGNCCCESCDDKITLIRSYGNQQWAMQGGGGRTVSCQGALWDFSSLTNNGSTLMSTSGYFWLPPAIGYCSDGPGQCQVNLSIGGSITCDSETGIWYLTAWGSNAIHYCSEYTYPQGWNGLMCYYQGETSIKLRIGDDGKLTGTYHVDLDNVYETWPDGYEEDCADDVFLEVTFNE